jgi:hypothetical protein
MKWLLGNVKTRVSVGSLAGILGGQEILILVDKLMIVNTITEDLPS